MENSSNEQTDGYNWLARRWRDRPDLLQALEQARLRLKARDEQAQKGQL